MKVIFSFCVVLSFGFGFGEEQDGTCENLSSKMIHLLESPTNQTALELLGEFSICSDTIFDISMVLAHQCAMSNKACSVLRDVVSQNCVFYLRGNFPNGCFYVTRSILVRTTGGDDFPLMFLNTVEYIAANGSDPILTVLRDICKNKKTNRGNQLVVQTCAQLDEWMRTMDQIDTFLRDPEAMKKNLDRVNKKYWRLIENHMARKWHPEHPDDLYGQTCEKSGYGIYCRVLRAKVDVYRNKQRRNCKINAGNPGITASSRAWTLALFFIFEKTVFN